MESFNEVQSVCLKVFESVANATSILVLPMFLGRVVFSNVLGQGNKALTTIKGVAIYFILVAGFPILLDILFSIPESFLPKHDSFSALSAGMPGWDLSTIPFAVDRVLEVVLAALYWIVYYLHIFFMLLMCSMAPVVFLLSTLMGVGLGLEIFIGLMIVGSSWPIIWYGFDQVHSSLISEQSDAFAAKCLELLVTASKGIAPVAFAGMAIKSPVGQSISKAAQMGIQGGKWAHGKSAPMLQAPGRMIQNYRENKRAAFEEHQRQFFPGSSASTQPISDSPDRLKRAASELKQDRNNNAKTPH